jgi:hypothetical protein
MSKFCEEKYIFNKILQEIQPSTVLLLDNGDSPIFFLLNVTNKSSAKYGLLVYSWDNPTTKLFPTEIFDFIGTWNNEQIYELARISNFPPNKTKVIGSKLSDRVRDTALVPTKGLSKSSLITHQLLITGMASKSDEVIDVMKIANIINSGNSFYKKLVYRPHPKCTYTLKFIEKFKNELLNLKVEINLNDDFNVGYYDSVICYPSTLLLEVIAAKNFAVFYTPRYVRWRVDPLKISKADYFDKVLALDAITCLNNYNDLVFSLKYKLPEIKEFCPLAFNNILPNLQSTFLERINSLVKSH